MNLTTAFANVPPGMSCINAFHALYENAEMGKEYKKKHSLIKFELDKVNTAEKIAELFKASASFEYVGGKLIKIDFSSFPKLDVSEYDKAWGVNAAKNALDKYKLVPSEDRFDKGDRYQFEILIGKSVKQDLDTTPGQINCCLIS